MRDRWPPSRGIRRIEPLDEWIAHLVRMSGKSVSASASMTPHAWFAASPVRVWPIALRTREPAPSAPTTYLARTWRVGPEAGSSRAFSSASTVRRRVTSTGCSPSFVSSRVSNAQP